MSSERDPLGSTGDWITNGILQGMIAALKLLPYPTRVAVTGRLIQSVVAPLAGYQKRAMDNLALVYPDMPRAKRRDIAQRTANNFGRTLIENYSGKGLNAQARDAKITGPGLDAFRAAQDAGRPVLLVTGHFGNHEVPRHGLDALGYEIGGLYRPMANVFFNAHYERTMKNVSGPVFAQGRRGTGQFVRFLRGGGAAVLLFDIYAKGPRLPFLGQPVKTPLSSAELALKYDAVIIPFFGIRQADGLSFEIELDAPIAHTTPEEMLLAMHAALEARIARHPDQWFWFHRRFKGSAKRLVKMRGG